MFTIECALLNVHNQLNIFSDILLKFEWFTMNSAGI